MPHEHKAVVDQVLCEIENRLLIDGSSSMPQQQQAPAAATAAAAISNSGSILLHVFVVALDLASLTWKGPNK